MIRVAGEARAGGCGSGVDVVRVSDGETLIEPSDACHDRRTGCLREAIINHTRRARHRGQ